METKMTENQSIEVITEMIARARRNFSRRNVYPTLFWGYMISAIALTNFVLLLTLSPEAQPYSYLVWLITIPVNIFWNILQHRRWKKAEVTTQIDHIAGAIWGGFGISNIFIIAVIAVIAIFTQSDIVWWLITPVIMTMVGAASFATAKAYKMKTMTWCAVVFWVGAVLSIAPYSCGYTADGHFTAMMHQSTQFIVLAAAMIAGFIVPSYIELRKLKSNV